MKTIFKWLGVVLSIALFIFSIYAIVGTAGITMDGDSYSGAVALLWSVPIMWLAASVLLCVGSLKMKKDFIILSVILIVLGVIMLFVSRYINITHRNNRYRY